MDTKTKELGSKMANECVALRLLMVNRVVTNIYDAVYRKFGIRVTQVYILGLLATKDAQEQSKISKMLQLEKSTVSRNLDRMESDGWIRRSGGGTDIRVAEVSLTRKGEKVLQSIEAEWEEAQLKFTSVFGSESVEIIRHMANVVWTSKNKFS
jgi:DNA-binding MarR family transcriptional regulator